MADSKQKNPIEDLYENFKKKHKYLPEMSSYEPHEGPLQRISKSYNNTFLHIAIRFKEKHLVSRLLRMLPNQEKLPVPLWNIKNNEGNTILHELASSDSWKESATDVVERYNGKDQELLIERNELGETPIFCAARHGQTEMFQFLAKKMKLTANGPENLKPYLQRGDGTTVLHISIFTECFRLACLIASSYKYLIVERGEDSMTALHYLACNPTAFGRKKQKMGQGFMENLMKSTSHKDKLHDWLLNNSKASDERCHLILEELVELLVKEDTTWNASKTDEKLDIELSQTKKGIDSQENKSKTSPERNEQKSEEKELKIEPSIIFGQESEDKKVQNSQGNDEQDFDKYKKGDESPLFLATISNIPLIVDKILIHHPQMLEHTNKEGRNILQLAILYRHKEIFDMVVNSGVLTSSLLSATDHDGNSLLHMVGQKRKSKASERMQCPAFQLQKELLFFQDVKIATRMHLTKPLNNQNKTAEELFATTNEKLHGKAKEWVMHTTENCTILCVFIATVAFAAAYTVPGGSDGSTGIPILHSKPFFLVFVLADVVSLTFALTSMGIFLSILISSFPLQHFQTYLFEKLKQGMICMIASVTMMAVAFGATIVLIMAHHRPKVVWYVIAFLPVPIFFVFNSPLRSAFLTSCIEWANYFFLELIPKFVLKFLRCVGWAVIIFFFLIFYHTYKLVFWIRVYKFNGRSPDQPTAAPLPQV